MPLNAGKRELGSYKYVKSLEREISLDNPTSAFVRGRMRRRQYEKRVSNTSTARNGNSYQNSGSWGVEVGQVLLFIHVSP